MKFIFFIFFLAWIINKIKKKFLLKDEIIDNVSINKKKSNMNIIDADYEDLNESD